MTECDFFDNLVVAYFLGRPVYSSCVKTCTVTWHIQTENNMILMTEADIASRRF